MLFDKKFNMILDFLKEMHEKETLFRVYSPLNGQKSCFPNEFDKGYSLKPTMFVNE